jgi:hypothetical protein
VLGIAMLRACRLAIEQANARGGYLKRKSPSNWCVRNDNALWGASGSEIIHLAYLDNVWAILGGIDGANTHIAIRVALKIEIPWMTPGDLDPTYIETNIPWVMRCIGDDRQQNYILLDYLFRKMNYQRVAIIRASNRYGRFGVREIRDGSPPPRPAAGHRNGLPRRRPTSPATRPHPRTNPMPSSIGATPTTPPASSTPCAPAAGLSRSSLRPLRLGRIRPHRRCQRRRRHRTYPWNPDRRDPKLESFKRRLPRTLGRRALTPTPPTPTTA